MNSQPACANAFAKAGHQARINGCIVGEVLLAAKVLTVGVLYPDGHDFLVGQVAGVLQELQANHQANGMAWPANARGIQTSKARLAGLPVDLLGQLRQGVAQVDQIDQFWRNRSASRDVGVSHSAMSLQGLRL